MISGQPPNVQTQSDCQTYNDFPPGPLTSIGSDGIVTGQGCVYPAQTQTVVNQLDSDGLTWKGYAQDMANSVASGQPASCRHPTLNRTTPRPRRPTTSTPPATSRSSTSTRSSTRPPAPPTSSISTDSPAISGRPRRRRTTPSSPPTSAPTATTRPVPTASRRAATQGSRPSCASGCRGSSTRPPTRTGGCCWSPSTRPRATTPAPAATSRRAPTRPIPAALTAGPGGGRVGAVALSPCIQPGTVTNRAYNHYSMLRWVEDNFGLGISATPPRRA